MKTKIPFSTTQSEQLPWVSNQRRATLRFYIPKVKRSASYSKNVFGTLQTATAGSQEPIFTSTKVSICIFMEKCPSSFWGFRSSLWNFMCESYLLTEMSKIIIDWQVIPRQDVMYYRILYNMIVSCGNLGLPNVWHVPTPRTIEIQRYRDTEILSVLSAVLEWN